jgi:uncharacterized protein (TIGR02145 family)
MKKNILCSFLTVVILFLLIIQSSCKKETIETSIPSDPLSDIDGNIYSTMKIGDQIWMAENLKVIHYRNGEQIANVTDRAIWPTLTTSAYCWYNNDANSYKADYGALYNWYAAIDGRNIAPTGWHIPSQSEWTTLINYLGGASVAGGKLKEVGTSHWTTQNTEATNSSGFTALPGGNGDFGFNWLGTQGAWWSTIEQYGDATGQSISNGISITFTSGSKHQGWSVRCIKD